MGVTEVVTAPRSPWQNTYVERVIGSLRRECLDSILIFKERHLRPSLHRTSAITTAPAHVFHLTMTVPTLVQSSRGPTAR